jgi:hypothetical protein
MVWKCCPSVAFLVALIDWGAMTVDITVIQYGDTTLWLALLVFYDHDFLNQDGFIVCGELVCAAWCFADT